MSLTRHRGAIYISLYHFNMLILIKIKQITPNPFFSRIFIHCFTDYEYRDSIIHESPLSKRFRTFIVLNCYKKVCELLNSEAGWKNVYGYNTYSGR
jgi:hypothetical protein